MSSTNGPTQPASVEERSAPIARALAWLRAEQNAADAPAYTPMLLHETAVILESCDELGEATRNYQAALSIDRDFREPLERLLALAERQHRCDELGALYQQLAASADIPDERTRACLERAFYLVERENDANSALQLLREVVADAEDNPVAWLLLDLVADRQNDFETRERALEARIGLTGHAAYRALLLMEWADLRQLAGDLPRALELLDNAIAEASPQTYPALLRKERALLRSGNWEEYRKAIEQRIRLVESAIADARAGEALGVSNTHRNPTALGCLHALVGQLQTQAGNLVEAEVALSQARTCLPEDSFVSYLEWIQAEHAENWERFCQIGEELGRCVEGDVSAWLSLRLALVRLNLGDVAGARRFTSQGLRAAPRSLALRALDVFLALDKGDGLALGAAIEQASECLESAADKATWLLAAAGIWAFCAHDATAAKAAMTQAGLCGLDPVLARHASRLLAAWSGDLPYYDEATHQAYLAAKDGEERVDLALELLRARLVHGNTAAAREMVVTLSADTDFPVFGALIKATLGRYLSRHLQRDAEQPSASDVVLDWERLAQNTTAESWQRALRLAAAVEHLVAGRTSPAKELLDRLGDEDPSDLLVTAARVALALDQHAAHEATAVLRRAAESTTDADVRAQLAYEGVIIGLRERTLEDLPQLLDLARLTHPEAADAISRWSLRRVADTQPALAQRVLEAARTFGSRWRRDLEDLGLSIVNGRWGTNEDMGALDPDAAPPALQVATVLAQHIASGDTPTRSNRELDAMPRALTAAHAALGYFERIARGDGEVAATTGANHRLAEAREWAGGDASLIAQLEWLFACHNANEFAEEAEARDRVAPHLTPKDADTMQVSAQLLRFLVQSPNLDLLPSVSAAARLANLEQSLPGCDPRRRATALEETGELLGTGSTAPLRVCLGFNQLAHGDNVGARRSFVELVDAHPRFIAGWLGLRVLAETTGDVALLAQACAALGDLLSDPAEAAAEWERSANLLLDELEDPARGERALERSVSLDVTRDSAFQRLFRLTRDAQRTEKLLELIALRLPHTTSESERLTLYWERARGYRTLGDRDGALAALDAVSAIDPNHVGALALAGEINITLGRFDDAARFLAQLARQTDAPVKQRLMGGLAAADLFDKKLNRPAFAKDILLDLHREGHSTEALRERLSALAVRVNAFPLALEILEIVMAERKSSAARAEAARLALVICRDQMHQPSRATRAVDRLLSEVPGDPEAIDLVLTGCFDEENTDRWLREAESLFRQRLIEQPSDPANLERLSRIALWFDDARTRQICLGALICLGAGTMELDRELALLDARVAHVPAVVVDTATLQAICAPEDEGPLVALFQDFAEVYAEALGPTLAVLGVGKKQRVDPRSGLPLRNEIAAWAGALGVADFDLYLSEQVDGDAVAIPGERPSLVVATRLVAPLDARGRQAVARELFALRRGTSLLRHRSMTELLALVSACCHVGGHPLSTPPYAMLEEFVRAIGSALPRRLRKTLSERAEAIARQSNDENLIKSYLVAAASSQDRAAALAAGDVSHVLAHLTGQRGRPPGTHELRDRTQRLLAFALSPEFLDLKDQLGLSVR